MGDLTPRFYIENITFSDDTTIEFNKDDIIVLVGSNNAGKSAALKETAAKLRNYATPTKVIKDIKIGKIGMESDFISRIYETSMKECSERSSHSYYRGLGYSVFSGNLDHLINNYNSGLSDTYPIFVNVLNTEQRLTAANPPTNIKLSSQPPQHPIHILQKSDAIEQRFSEYFRLAFGTDLIIHRNAGSEVPLYVGEKPIPKEGEDRVSEGYLQELEKLDLLHQQGDGMRSFVGLLLNTFIGDQNILFIDEPEAFLHPPQARLLGKMFGKDLPNDKQLFLATHSGDFLRGLLETKSSNLKIIRINRNGNINNISILNSEEINTIWNDSLLRHSNILDGLFHSKVVICESDSDSRFYSAILDCVNEENQETAQDILFINVGGKHRISVAVKALKKLSVPIKVIVDFDILNSEEPLKTIYQELGGIWQDIKKDWELVKNSIESKRPEFLTQDVKSEIQAILDETKEKIFPKSKVNDIQQVLKKSSPWTEAKVIGKAYIPSGNPTQAFERIQNKFIEMGLLILEVGELESFVKSVGNHGPKWVNNVLSKDIKKDSEFEIAKEFVKHI